MSAYREALPGGSVWWQWTLANAVGLTVAMTARQLILGLVVGAVGGTAGRLLVGAVIGLVVGFAQRLLLGEHLQRPGWWVAANALGWAVGWSAGWLAGWDLFGTMGLNAVFTATGATAGTLAGLLQWVALRRQSRAAAWWIPASALGWALGWAVGLRVGQGAGWLLIGALGGAVTGLPLVWLLRRPPARDAAQT